MSKYLIRPHHMLCMQFFDGKGYSDGFVASMAAIKEKLEKELEYKYERWEYLNNLAEEIAAQK